MIYHHVTVYVNPVLPDGVSPGFEDYRPRGKV